jgi:tRNA nucleotidyltransferase/poly(A) polymerase
MATIEQNSYEAMKQNIHMLSIITKERIWEEIVKGYKQAKDFSEYMYILYDIGTFDVIFPNLNIKIPLRK